MIPGLVLSLFSALIRCSERTLSSNLKCIKLWWRLIKLSILDLGVNVGRYRYYVVFMITKNCFSLPKA